MEEQALRESESQALKSADLERRAQALEDRERNLTQQAEELKRQKRVQRRELERISGLTASQAKELLLADVEQEARHQAGLRLVELEEQTKREAERRARSILSVAMQRLAPRHSGESTTRLVELPGDEMKGRIIGRDGRNIRALEQLTGVDVIIDETPNAVLLSSFDGVRREIARLTVERLVADGRITPALIEETYDHAREQIEQRIVEEGERAALEAHVNGLDPKLMELLGQLKFRTSSAPPSRPPAGRRCCTTSARPSGTRSTAPMPWSGRGSPAATANRRPSRMRSRPTTTRSSREPSRP
jgi:ribonuclease Y